MPENPYEPPKEVEDDKAGFNWPLLIGWVNTAIAVAWVAAIAGIA